MTYFKIYKGLLQLNKRMTTPPQTKLAKHLDKHLTKEDIQTAHKQVKRCSRSLAIREILIKTMMQCHTHPL